MSGITRRKFLQGMGAAALSALLPACLRRKEGNPMEPPSPTTVSFLPEQRTPGEISIFLAASGYALDGQLTTFRYLREAEYIQAINGMWNKGVTEEGLIWLKQSSRFSILYDPKNNSFLRVAMQDTLLNRLGNSTEGLRASLRVTGLDDSLVVVRQLTVEGRTYWAMETPRLGESLYSLMVKNGGTVPGMEDILQQVEINAWKLLKEESILARDINPGNIIITPNRQVILIDLPETRARVSHITPVVENCLNQELEKLRLLTRQPSESVGQLPIQPIEITPITYKGGYRAFQVACKIGGFALRVLSKAAFYLGAWQYIEENILHSVPHIEIATQAWGENAYPEVLGMAASFQGKITHQELMRIVNNIYAYHLGKDELYEGYGIPITLSIPVRTVSPEGDNVRLNWVKMPTTLALVPFNPDSQMAQISGTPIVFDRQNPNQPFALVDLRGGGWIVSGPEIDHGALLVQIPRRQNKNGEVNFENGLMLCAPDGSLEVLFGDAIQQQY